MKISDDDLIEFMAIYEQEFGEQLTSAEASEMTTRLINLYMILVEPLPSEREATQLPSTSEFPHASHIAHAPNEEFS